MRLLLLACYRPTAAAPPSAGACRSPEPSTWGSSSAPLDPPAVAAAAGGAPGGSGELREQAGGRSRRESGCGLLGGRPGTPRAAKAPLSCATTGERAAAFAGRWVLLDLDMLTGILALAAYPISAWV